MSPSNGRNVDVMFENTIITYENTLHSDEAHHEDSVKTVVDKLRNIDWDFSDADTGYLTHDLHPYAAKFIPQIPSALIQLLSFPGEIIWDPFGGSGTTALEAMIHQRRAISTDANPLSTVIGQAKTTALNVCDASLLKEWAEALRVLGISTAKSTEEFEKNRELIQEFTPDIPNIEKWFHASVITELAYIRGKIEVYLKSEAQRVAARAALSRLIIKTSYQDGETRYTAIEKDITPGIAVRQFADDLDYCINRMTDLRRYEPLPNVSFLTYDLRQPFTEINSPIRANSIGLIVTSPPYPNAYDYHLYHRFRLFWLGYDPRKLGKVEIGSHLRHQKEDTGFANYKDEMHACLKNFWYALQPGRYAILVVGDGIFKGRLYRTAEELAIVGQEIGFDLVDIIDREIHQTKRAFAAPAQRARKEQLLVLRKPENRGKIFLSPPNYKMWDYEFYLRLRETRTLTGIEPIQQEDALILDDMHPARLVHLSRMTFSHAYSYSQFENAVFRTNQSLLELGVNPNGSLRKESNYLTHGVHAYKGKFYPQLVKSLMNIAGLERGNTVLDVFGGSGTTVIEGYLHGMQSYGCDFNPLAARIGMSKLQMLQINPMDRARALEYFSGKLASLSDVDFVVSESVISDWFQKYSNQAQKEIVSWFPRSVIGKLAHIWSVIAEIDNQIVQDFLEILVSSIVRDISQQEPRDLRIRRRKEPILNASVFGLLHQVLKAQERKLGEFDRIRDRLTVDFGTAHIWQGDSRDMANFKNSGLGAGEVDAVITSPPYASALPYIDTDRLSILLLFNLTSSGRGDIEREITGTREITQATRKSYDDRIGVGDFGLINFPVAIDIIQQIYDANSDANVGFRRKNRAALLFKYFEDMTQVMNNVNQLLRVNGQAFFVLGNNRTKAKGDWIEISSTDVLADMARLLGWETEEVIPISVTKEDYAHSRNSITENYILWFRKVSD